MVNAAHISILRRVDNRGYNAGDINATTLGIPSSLYQIQPNGLQMAEGKFSIGGGTNSVAHFNDNTGSIDDDVTWVHGKHQIGFGGEWVQNQLNIGNVYEGNGIFTFNGEYSGSGPKGGSTIGDQNLDFLMGTLGSSTPFQQSKKQQNALRGPIPSLYVQDTYHATPRLTLVGGLRWGPEILPVDYFNRGVEFNMADFIANKSSSVYPNAPAGALYYGDPGVSRQFTSNHLNQFSPNVGLSFDPVGNGKTVIRAGGALMWDNPNFFTSQRNQQNPPFATAVTNVQTSSSGPIPFAAPWSTGAFTTSPFPQPAVPTPSQALFFAQSQYIVTPPNFKPAYTIQWTLSVQREFEPRLAGTARLHRQHHAARSDGLSHSTRPCSSPVCGVRAERVVRASSPPDRLPSSRAQQAPTAPQPGTRPPASCSPQRIRRVRTRREKPPAGTSMKAAAAARSSSTTRPPANYNGLIASIQHRLSNTFSLFANWTWSKCLNIYDAQGDLCRNRSENPYNPGLDYGPCGSDYRHIENVVLVAKSGFNNHLNRSRSGREWLGTGAAHPRSNVACPSTSPPARTTRSPTWATTVPTVCRE